MSRSRKEAQKLPEHLCYKNNAPKEWARISKDLLTSEAFCELTPAEMILYVCCCVHAESKEGQQVLYNALTDYGVYETDVDIQGAVHGSKRCKTAHDLFVFPASHLKHYGYDRSNANKLFARLRAKGFISVFRQDLYNKRVNIYKFENAWKRQGKIK